MLNNAFKFGSFVFACLALKIFTFYFVAIAASLYLAVVFDSFSCRTNPSELGCRLGASSGFSDFVQVASLLLAIFLAYTIFKRLKIF